jgi:ubiquinone/menaquinone biosynthesis C-methylase UbiE
MIFTMFADRCLKLEYIDTGDYTPQEYAEFMREIALVNRFAGDYWALRRSLLADAGKSGEKKFSVLDVGAGSGELLRQAADFAGRHNLTAELTGLELNPEAVAAIQTASQSFNNIRAIEGNALALPFPDDSFDYAMCSLFTHHLSDTQIIAALKEMKRVARRGIYVIDLHRHPAAYFLYTTVARLFIKGRLVRHDGALSILRSFKADELKHLGEMAGLEDISVMRRFPFRLVLKASAK